MIKILVLNLNRIFYFTIQGIITSLYRIIDLIALLLTGIYRLIITGSALMLDQLNRQRIKQDDFLQAVSVINNEYSDEEVFSRKPLCKSKKLHIDCYTENLEKYKKISFKFQRLGYNEVIDEDGTLAGLMWNGCHIRLKHPYIAKLINEWLDKYGSSGLRVLDIGTGNCSSIEMLNNLLISAERKVKFFGCDISEKMLSYGIERIYNKKIKANLSLSDGQDLPFKDNSFDLVTNFGSINQFPDIHKGLDEMIRVAKPGGLCICRDEFFDRNQLTPFEEKWFIVLSHDQIPYYVPEHSSDVKIEKINKINFVLSFIKLEKE